jgi:DNA invertase Pin-like site-specific DNA recombinase
MNEQKRVAFYANVCRDGTPIEHQLRELEGVATIKGWQIVGQFVDFEIRSANEFRPGFDGLCHAMERQQCDMVAAWSVDCLGRNLEDILVFLNELHSEHTGLYLQQQHLDTTAAVPVPRRLVQVLAIAAEFERSRITERLRAGLERAKYWAGRNSVGR